MRPDLDPKSIVKLHLIGTQRITHPNGAVTEAADYTGYRAEDKAGNTRIFLALRSGDSSVDWLDITPHKDSFTIVITGKDLVEKSAG